MAKCPLCLSVSVQIFVDGDHYADWTTPETVGIDTIARVDFRNLDVSFLDVWCSAV